MLSPLVIAFVLGVLAFVLALITQLPVLVLIAVLFTLPLICVIAVRAGDTIARRFQ
ncbi:hypothetical protein MN032_17670 [Agromyces atrinae]|uniref:hypothetical protein n=1 Tax=Agromyces atrinae TaxID=592376 RepID=UPI001F564D9C|nr:hypothetical protein [Agromyces atrinae]MCI2959517.1 hypothetical protein [Agromyces atrinae]